MIIQRERNETSRDKNNENSKIVETDIAAIKKYEKLKTRNSEKNG